MYLDLKRKVDSELKTFVREHNIALAKENLGQFNDAISNYEKFLRFWLGEARYKQIAKQLGVARTTLYRTLKAIPQTPSSKSA